MNMKNAILSLLALTSNVASADEVRAIRLGIRGDRPTSSVLPDENLKKKLPKDNAGKKSDLEEHRFVPEDNALDEDNESKISSEVETPGHLGIYNALYATSNGDLLESKDGSRDEESASEIDLAQPYSSDLCQGMHKRCKDSQWGNQTPGGCNVVYHICKQEVASQKFSADVPGWCQDSEGRDYKYIWFKDLTGDQCKKECNDIPEVKVQGVGVGKVNSPQAGSCICYLDRNHFRGCREFPNNNCVEEGVHGVFKGTGSVGKTAVQGNINKYFDCFYIPSSRQVE